jgi:hypothetical protein
LLTDELFEDVPKSTNQSAVSIANAISASKPTEEDIRVAGILTHSNVQDENFETLELLDDEE